MKYELTAPCGNCPFRTEPHFYMSRTRRREIAKCIVQEQGTFTCHKTLDLKREEQQHCAGAMILLEKIEKPNQMMRIAERLGFYDRRKLKMDSPVYDSITQWIAAGDK